MTDSLHAHDVSVQPADSVMAALVDAREALRALAYEAMNVQCRGCDPDGSRTEQTRVDLLDHYDVDPIDADMLLSQAADVRAALLGILIPPCTHDHGEDDTDG